jgi:hypothetical protein
VAAHSSQRPSVAQGRLFAFTLAAGFAGLGLLTLWRGSDRIAGWFAGLAGAVLLAGLIVPTRLGTVMAWWTALGEAIGRVTTPVILGFIYFGVVTPLGLLRRAVRRHTGPASTAWREAGAPGPRSRLERQF